VTGFAMGRPRGLFTLPLHPVLLGPSSLAGGSGYLGLGGRGGGWPCNGLTTKPPCYTLFVDVGAWTNGSLLGLFPAFIFVADPVGCTTPLKIDAHFPTLAGTEVTTCSSSYHGHNEDDHGN
jgi:hypothetical protein